MIVLRAPKPSYFWLGTWLAASILAELASLFLLIAGCLELWRVWDDPDPWARANALLTSIVSLIGFMALAWEIYRSIRPRREVILMVASRRRLGVKRAGRPLDSYTPEDVAGFASDGGVFILRDGARLFIQVPKTRHEEREVFLKGLYAQWWPDLSLEEVRSHLQSGGSANTPVLFAGFLWAMLILATLLLLVIALTVNASLLWIVGSMAAGAVLLWFAVISPQLMKEQRELWYPLDTCASEENG